MKKKWIYIVLMLVIVVGFFYMVLEKEEAETPGVTNEESQKEDDQDEAKDGDQDEDKKAEAEKDDFIEAPEEDDSALPDIAVGKKLPDFTLMSLDGKNVNLRDLEGKMLVLNFWATWCPYCVKEMPDLQQLQDENEDLVVLAVNVDEKKKMVEDYINEGGYKFQVALDEGGKVARDYLVINMPTTYFVNKEGLLYGGHSGALTYDQMNGVINDLREYKGE